MAEDNQEPVDPQNAEGAEIGDNDIVFDCPHCGKGLCIDYRGAGLQIECSGCHEQVLVPIPDGMELADLDLDVGEALKARLLQLQEALGVMQDVVAEGLA